MKRFLTFKSPGPIASAFLADQTSFVRALRGPVGGGKTVACMFDCLQAASRMPVCNDGKIRYRVAIIGLTYGQIERNLLPTWTAWLPKDGGEWTEAEMKGGGGRHATHTIRFAVLRNGRPVEVEFEAIFAAIGENAAEQFMRGFEPTAFWLYEMDQLPEDVLSVGLTRLGRYPRRVDLPDGVRYRSYVIGDLNSPDHDSWFYRTFEEQLPAGFAQYVQPSGLSPEAENRENLPPDYYERQVAALAGKPNLIKRMVLNEYAPSAHGQPVYAEYSDQRHLAPVALQAIKGLPLKIGVDAGLRAPAAVICQRTTAGQYRILGEVVPGRVGTKSFAMLLRKEIAEVAPGVPIDGIWCDPAGFSGGDAEDAQLAWAETLSLELGVPVLPAPSNELGLRLDAVRDELNGNIDGNTPALLVSRRCKVLRKGFASHYRYAERLQAGSKTLAPKPDKGDWSHIHDALQYALLGDKGRFGVISSKTGRQQARGHAKPVVLQNATRIFA